MRSRPTGRATRRRCRRSSAGACSATSTCARSARYIDWGPFFQAWELAGPYPAILDDPVVGEAARTRVRRGPGDARADRSTAAGSTANGVVALLPAQRGRRRHRDVHRRVAHDVALTWRNLRQQNERPRGQAELLPRRFRRAEDRASRDYIGAFAVTTGGGIERSVASSRRPRTTNSAHAERRSPTGSPKRSPNGCTARAARAVGLRDATRRSTTRR